MRGKHTYSKDGINWVWFATISHEGAGNGYAYIHAVWREHKGEINTGPTVGEYELLEDSSRTVKAVRLGDSKMVVAVDNAQHVLSYGSPELNAKPIWNKAA